MTAKLSILTVCRNEAARIRRTAESVAGQTCPDFEWIAVDGGSNDGTREILEEYRSRMAGLISEPDGGVYEAMNKAARLARGEWLLFLNGGDALAGREVVAEILPRLGERGEDIVVGAHLCVWPKGRPPLRKAHPGTSLDLHHFYRQTVNHQSAFIGRRVFERFGPYDVSFRLLADYDFFVRSVLGGTGVRCIPNLIAEYDMTGMSARMKGQKSMAMERRRIRGRYPISYRIRRLGSDLVVAWRNRMAGAKNGGRMDSPEPSLALVIGWFGPLPFWMPAFLLSCRRNPGVEWRIFSDAAPPPGLPDNVKFLPMTVDEFNRRATQALGFEVRVTPAYAYKLCDLKIMYGRIFERELQGFDFWGCCDLDVVWGNIRSFITPEVLREHDVITSRPDRIAGHFCLFRNRPEWTGLFRRIPEVAARAADSGTYRRIDEDGLTDLLQGYQSSRFRRFWAHRVQKLPLPRVYWKRVLTTNGQHQRLLLVDPALVLRWAHGKAYNAHGEEMMYLHFHAIAKGMKGIDFGFGDSPEEFALSPAGFSVVRKPGNK